MSIGANSSNLLQFHVKQNGDSKGSIATQGNVVFMPKFSENPLLDFLAALYPEELHKLQLDTNLSEVERDELLNITLVYNLKILRSRLAEEWWEPENQEFRLCIYDRSIGEWVALGAVKRNGEDCYIAYIEEPSDFEVVTGKE